MSTRQLPLSAAGLAYAAAAEFDGPRPVELLLRLLGREEGGEKKPQDEGRDGQERDGSANFAEMQRHAMRRKPLAVTGTVAKS